MVKLRVQDGAGSQVFFPSPTRSHTPRDELISLTLLCTFPSLFVLSHYKSSTISKILSYVLKISPAELPDLPLSVLGRSQAAPGRTSEPRRVRSSSGALPPTRPRPMLSLSARAAAHLLSLSRLHDPGAPLYCSFKLSVRPAPGSQARPRNEGSGAVASGCGAPLPEGGPYSAVQLNKHFPTAAVTSPHCKRRPGPTRRPRLTHSLGLRFGLSLCFPPPAAVTARPPSVRRPWGSSRRGKQTQKAPGKLSASSPPFLPHPPLAAADICTAATGNKTTRRRCRCHRQGMTHPSPCHAAHGNFSAAASDNAVDFGHGDAEDKSRRGAFSA